MAIQQSVNSALGTLGVVAGGVKHLKNQEEAKEKETSKELKELENEDNMVKANIGSIERDYNKTAQELESASNEALLGIDEYYTNQESGEPTDVKMYNKAMQSYKDKIQALKLQQQGNEEWMIQLNERRRQIQERINSIKGGKR